jgi:hypothetical protein
MAENNMSDEGPLDSLSKKLYEPGAESLTQLHRSGFHEEMHDVPQDFPHADVSSTPMKKITKHHTAIRWFFLGAVVFFLASLSAAYFFLSGGRNLVSADKIDMTVSGPVTTAAGDTLPLAIEIYNRNPSPLQIADVIVEYPPGTRDPSDSTKDLLRTRLSLGTIDSGKRIATSTSAVLFSEEGTEQKITVSLEYRVPGSSAIFLKESGYSVRIGASPLSLTVSAPESINSGQDIDITLSVSSNSSAPLQNVVLSADYPFGFTFKSADPKPSFSNTLWALSTFSPEQKQIIHIRGTLSGQDEEDRIFRFKVGLASEQDATQLGTAFAETDQTVTVARPFIDTRLSVNGQNASPVIVRPGDTAHVEVSWKNNLPTKLTDGSVIVKLSGDAVDKKSVRVLKGFYDSGKNTVSVDKRDDPALAVINAGDSGVESFTFDVAAVPSTGSGRVNPTITLSVAFLANATAESGTPEQVRADTQGTITVSSAVRLSGVALHNSGPLETSGPIPPKVEQKTVYTVVWTISNAVNDVSNATVKATLPSYMTWEGVVSPGTADIAYDSTLGQVIWNAGAIRSGVGFSTPAQTVAFQVGLTPSLSQIGTAPILIQDATLSAVDTVSGATVGSTQSELTTLIESDTGFQLGQERVTE